MTHSEEMLAALKNEDLVQAQLSLEMALKKDEPAVLAELGDELFQLGFLDEAKSIYLKLIEKDPNDEWSLYLAEILIENNEIDEAFEWLEKISSESPLYVNALIVTADLYQLLGIPEVSEAKLKEAKKILPNEALINLALAELYYSMNEFNKAQDYYLELINEHHMLANISIFERLGMTLSLQGKFEEALEYFEEALKEQLSADTLFQIGFVYLQLKETEKAIHYFEQVKELDPQYQAVYLYLAEALQELERLNEAQAVIEEGIAENPYQVEFYHFASENSYRLNQIKQAEEFLVAALETGEKTDETLLTLSNLYLNEGFYDEVIEAISQMEDQEHPYALWNLARAYNELEEYDHAAKYYDEANRTLHHEVEFMKEFGVFLREEGQLERAHEILSHYLAHEPGDLEVQSLLEDW